MKLVYEEGEIERLEQARMDWIEKGNCSLFENNPDRMYNLSFKVVKPGLAEYILLTLLNNRLEDFDLGIDIRSINFDAVTNKRDLKNKLHEMIEEIVN